MNKKERTKETINIVINLFVILILSLFFYYIWQKYYHDRVYFFRRGNWFLLAIYMTVLTALNFVFGGFRLGHAKTTDLIFSQSLALFFTNLVVYGITALILLGFLPVRGFIIYYLAQVCIVIVLNIIIRFIYYRVFPPRKTLVVYEGGHHFLYEKIMKYQSDAYDIQKEELFDDFEKHPSEMEEYECIIAVGLNPMQKNRLIHETYEATKSLYIVPDVYDIIMNNAKNMYLVDTPLLSANNFGPSQLSKLIKRIFDIIFALVLLVIGSPFMLVTAIAILIQDGAPIIYKQKRLTQYGREFNIYKFRSMRKDAEKDGVARFASENDSRITPVGKFIRKTRLDELPQLWNILIGDMSVVGPRPERPEIVEKILKDIPEFNYRLKVKAGLTGYAQVYGKYNTHLRDKLLLDLYYIENFSILLDLKIMFLTFKILFMKESTEGVQENSK